MTRLEEIEARCNAATPCEWLHSEVREAYEDECSKGVVVGVDVVAGEDGPIICHCTNEDDLEWVANSKFIAHSRQDVPFLIFEIRKLQGDLYQAQWCLDQINSRVCPGTMDSNESLKQIIKEHASQVEEIRKRDRALEFWAEAEETLTRNTGIRWQTLQDAKEEIEKVMGGG